MATYPGALFVPTVVSDDPGGTEIVAAHHNSQDSEILAIETELGTDVAGSLTNLKTRLAVSLADNGTLKLANSTVLTITSGAITVTQNFHRIATEGGAATDDLDTINGLAADGTVLFIRPSTANDIVIKHNTGNIVTADAVSITLSDTNQYAILVYDTNLSKWIAGKLSSASSGGVRTFTTKTADYTLTTSDVVVYANKATAITLTLPAATGSGREFVIKNIGAGACTVDGDSSDTIDGETTQVLNQYDAITIQDRAANAWSIY